MLLAALALLVLSPDPGAAPDRGPPATSCPGNGTVGGLPVLVAVGNPPRILPGRLCPGAPIAGGAQQRDMKAPAPSPPMSMAAMAAIFDDIIIAVERLSHWPEGKVCFRLTNGGPPQHLSLLGLEVRVAVRRPGSDLEPPAGTVDVPVDRPCWIQLEVKAGFPVTSGMLLLLRRRRLVLLASGGTTFPDTWKRAEVCVLEKVADLQALPVVVDLVDSRHVAYCVPLQRGALWSSSQTGVSGFSAQIGEMAARRKTFQMENPAGGSLRLQAWNASSASLKVDVINNARPPVLEPRPPDDRSSKKQSGKRVRVKRSPISVKAVPSAFATSGDGSITLVAEYTVTASSPEFHWDCSTPCDCRGPWRTLSHTVSGHCLPDPLHFHKYTFSVGQGEGAATASQCITLSPDNSDPHWFSLTCMEGCDPSRWRNKVRIKLLCQTSRCPEVVWYIEDIRNQRFWDWKTRSCYLETGKKPLTQKQNGGGEYFVGNQYLLIARMKRTNITVVVTSAAQAAAEMPFYKTYNIEVTPYQEDTGPPTERTATAAESDENQGDVMTASPVASATAVMTYPASLRTTDSFNSFSCSISPASGTVLQAFSISCRTALPCPDCLYCFKTEGKHLRFSSSTDTKYLYLPGGRRGSDYNLVIVATAQASSFRASTTVSAQVLDSDGSSNYSVDELLAAVREAAAQLKREGLFSGEILGQLLSSVADKLKYQTDEAEKTARQELREEMLDILIEAAGAAPAQTPEGVQVLARGLCSLIRDGSELSASAQEGASLLLANLSQTLLHMIGDQSAEAWRQVRTAAGYVVEGASSILGFSTNRDVSESVLIALGNTQRALLMFHRTNDDPTIIQRADVSVFVRRVTPQNLHLEPITIPNCTCAAFGFPPLPLSKSHPEAPVDIRMLSLGTNPFSWSGKGNISGLIGALSLAAENGSAIPLQNLSKDIEVRLPRPGSQQVNISVLDLRNFSTTVLDIPSAEDTLVLKMMPSEDGLPFKVLLGHQSYPTQAHHVAVTQMPHEGNTLDERYTWLLDPKTLRGNTGVHYLVVRPILGPGVKEVNATLSIRSFATSCRFWDKLESEWRDRGCRVGARSSPLVASCLCNHLTFFGSSFFVTPHLVDPSRSAELFRTFTTNPVVVCFIGSLFAAYLLVVVWARRRDAQDTAKVKVTVLEDNDPRDEYRYLLSVSTGFRRGAATSSRVTIILLGAEGSSEPHHLIDKKKRLFERGAVDIFLLTTPFSLGDLHSVRLWHNNAGSHSAWYVSRVLVCDLQTKQRWHFLCNSWLAIDTDDCSLDKVFPVSTEADLKKFSNLFLAKTTKDFSDGHLWYSVVGRPPNSNFTRVQRVSCCFSLLLCTMLTGIMFYGIPEDPSEQTMDLGHFEFTWQQFMIGVQSSLMMFPINILIVGVFRNARPWAASCCTRRTEGGSEEANPSKDTVDSLTLDGVIQDIMRMVRSLSGTVRSTAADANGKLGLAPQVDIDAALSALDDVVRQSEDTFSLAPPPGSGRGGTALGSDGGAETQATRSSKAWRLLRRLHLLEKDLGLLEASAFPEPDAHSRALLQLRATMGLVEGRLRVSRGDDLRGPAQARSSHAGGKESGDAWLPWRQCRSALLPWWFVFVGWVLVAATAGASAYFTMLYGLKFGKERSVSWLVSMAISFLQSLVIIQPLKVLLLATFFALVVKKVEGEDFENAALTGSHGKTDEVGGRAAAPRDCSQYEPPRAADVEEMRRRKRKEEKAFAFIIEILIYGGFMWTLLLVAHGQRDQNAFLLHRHLQRSFVDATPDSMSLDGVLAWANATLLGNLFGAYPGFITDGNSKLVGAARLRQVRVRTNSCQIAASMLGSVPACNAPYSWEAEDTGSYWPGWDGPASSLQAVDPWRYRTGAQIRARPFWGKIALYRGGGFVAELGPDLQNASSTLEYLSSRGWLDANTRAVFAEFTIYNANVNLFCAVTLSLETTGVGTFQLHNELWTVRLYQSPGGFHIFVMAAEIVYLLFILYYMFLQGKLMKRQRWMYFRSTWNLLELSVILLSWAAVGVFILRSLLGNRDVANLKESGGQIASFQETAAADSALGYLTAFLVFLATVKLWRLLRLHPTVSTIAAALHRGWSDMTGFLVVIGVLLLAYSTLCNLAYGWKLSSYRTLADALLTIISMQVGIFNYQEVLDQSPLLGPLLLGSCIVVLTFVILNLFISVILSAFSQEQMHHAPSEEEEILDLLWEKTCGLFGVGRKETP